MHNARKLTVLWGLVFVPFQVAGQSVAIPRVNNPLILDGIVDELGWVNIEPLPLTAYEPVYGAPLTEDTDIRVAHDGDYLWLSGRLYDVQPMEVRANSLTRDRPAGGDEFGVVVDPLRSNEAGLHFYTNPAGVRFDQSIANDAENRQGPDALNPDWNTFWDVVTRQTEAGWFVEMRIPLSSLGIRATDGTTVMGMTVYRYIARKNERQTFPAIRPDWQSGYLKPSQSQLVSLAGVNVRRPIYVTPYVKTGVRRSTVLDEPNAFIANHDNVRDLGLDAKLVVREAMTLDVSANMDFAEVEADDQRVNLTRFPLFFPEKRQFFQERANLFEVGTGNFDRVFHSRRIGLAEGESVPILLGARLVGRVGSWDIGAVDIVDRSFDRVVGANYGVARVRRQVLNPFSYAGGIVTSRHDGASYNVAGGVDGVVRVAGRTYLTTQILGSVDHASTSGVGLASSLLRLRFERRGQLGWVYQTDIRRIGANYNPALGFVERRGVIRADLTFGRGWSAGPNSWVRTFWPNFLVVRTAFRTDDRTLESAFVAHFFNVEAKDGTRLWLGFRTEFEDLVDTLVLPEGVFAPPGSYVFPTMMTGFIMGQTRRYSLGGTANVGRFYDGWRFSGNVGPDWNPSRHLELSGQYQVDVVRFTEREQSLTSHVVRLRAEAARDARLSGQILLQVNSVERRVTPSVRLRYNLREGSDVWVVYDEAFNLDRERAHITLPFSSQRVVIVKFNHTLVL